MKKTVFALLMSACLFACDEDEHVEEPVHVPVPVAIGGTVGNAVDLGLPSGILWADHNVGSSTPEEAGLCFAWGEVLPKENYGWSTYSLSNGKSTSLLKYCFDVSCGEVDSTATLDLQDDAAFVNWGENWRTPTLDEQNELREMCVWTWKSDFAETGVSGYEVMGPNGNSIFLPASGNWRDNEMISSGKGGYYWSSTVLENYSGYACFLSFSSSKYDWGGHNRCYGLFVRPVAR